MVKLKFIVGVVAITFLLVGCTRERPLRTSVIETTVPATKIMSNDGHNWISHTFGPHTSYYVVSTTKISKVNKLLYDFHGNNPINYAPSYWTTDDSDAVKVYSIPGVDTKKEVAVRLNKGFYVEAELVGSRKP